jgi:hypothetical protein
VVIKETMGGGEGRHLPLGFLSKKIKIERKVIY